MHNRKFFLSLVLVGIFFFTSKTFSEVSYIETTAKGKAETFEIALKKAFKRAIEKVNGVSLESNSVLETIDKTITTDGESSATLSRDLQETIKEKTKGSIKTFVITNEFKDSNGIYNVEINATIAKFALSKSAKRKRMAIVPFRINVNEISIFGETYDDADNLRKYLNQEFTNFRCCTDNYGAFSAVRGS